MNTGIYHTIHKSKALSTMTMHISVMIKSLTILKGVVCSAEQQMKSRPGKFMVHTKKFEVLFYLHLFICVK